MNDAPLSPPPAFDPATPPPAPPAAAWPVETAPAPDHGVDYSAPALPVHTAATGPIDYNAPAIQVVPGAAQPYHYPPVPDPIEARPLVGDRIALPSGGWVQLRHTNNLRSKHRSYVMERMPLDEGAFDMGVLNQLQRAIAEVMIVDWHLPYAPDARIPSLQLPDPATGEGSSLGEVDLRDEDVLLEKLRPVMDLLTPKKVDPGQHADPRSPTGPEGASGRA